MITAPSELAGLRLRRLQRLGIAWAAVCSAACTASNAYEVSVPLEVAGTALSTPIEGRDGWTIELDRAEVAFGPLYLCGGTQAGELCDTARAEWIDTVVIDALDAAPQRAGRLRGISGATRSWMYDLGISSLLTQPEPLVLDAATTLGGSSVVLVGRAENGGARVAFRAEIAIQQDEGTERGVPVVRKSASDDFDHLLDGSEQALRVRFDATSWVVGIDWTAAALDAEDGEVVFEAESQGFRSIRNDVVAGGRPSFEWRP